MTRQTTRHGGSARAIAGAALLAVALATGIASGQTPQFRTTVEIVQLQVQLADSTGRHIPNLEPSDFALRVDGELRDLVAVYEVDLRRESSEDPSDYVPPAGWRQFLLFFDFSFSTRQGVLRAQEAARKFVEGMVHPRDLIGVATFTTVGGLKLVSPFTADRAQVLSALNTFGLHQGQHIVDPAGFAVEPFQDLLEMELARSTDNDFDGDDDTRTPAQQSALEELFAVTFDSSAQDFRRYRERVVNYTDQLAALGPLLQAANGRKHVVLFTAGFDDKVLTGQSLDELAEDRQRIDTQGVLGLAAVNSETRFGSIDVRDSLQRAVENFRRSDVVFHAFDVGGVGNERRDDTFATTQSGKQGLAYIADATNGTVTWNANDLAPYLGKLAEDTAQYYVIAYRKMPQDGLVVELDLEILRPGAKVVAAPKRFAPPPAYTEMDEAQRQLQLAEFIAKGIEQEDMTFDVRAVPFVGKGRVSRVAVVLEVPFQQLEAIAKARGDGKAELDMLGYVLDEAGEMRDLFSRRARLDVDRITQNLTGLPFRYYDLLWSLPGDQRVRVLVRDAQVGMLSTRTVDVHVPAFEITQGVLVSGPVAIDAAHPGLMMRGIDAANPPVSREGGPVAYPFVLGEHEVTPEVYTVARPGGTSTFMLVAYNMTRHPFTGQTQTNLDARLIDELGNERPLAELRLIGREYDAETDSTTLVAEAVLPATLAPGAYLIEIDLVDAVSGQVVQQVLPLLVSSEVAER